MFYYSIGTQDSELKIRIHFSELNGEIQKMKERKSLENNKKYFEKDGESTNK